MIDEDGMSRLLEARVRWRLDDADPDLHEVGPRAWEVLFEGHLCRLIEHDDERPGRFSVLVDGEPMGDLDEWPSGWASS